MDFAPDNTNRIVYHYVAAGVAHSITLRGRPGESLIVSQDRTDNLIMTIATQLSPYLPVDWAITSVDLIPEGSNVSFPGTPPTTDTGGVLVADFTKQDKISHLTFQGKSVGGSKANFKVYCVQFDPDVLPAGDEANFRFTPGENADIDSVVAAANSLGLNGIDGLTVIWYGFVNLKVNDYWLRQVRKGAV